MQSIPLNVNIPDMVSISESELKILLAAKLYETQKLSLGQAADVANLSKRTFIEMLGRYGVSLFSANAEELVQDIANA
ncbi:MAG: UPF0175 family protein [Oscillospiraceae bacterium]|nr:UPF0175 family protein [Oscillospiraceae bacterium]